jgi:hypothetical protein
VAERLRSELGIEVNLTHGKTGEFSVLVAERVVGKKHWFRFPQDEAIVTAVRDALQE